MSNFFELSEETLLKNELTSTLSLLGQIISYRNSVKKLTNHPINDWYEWFNTEVISDMVTPALLLMNEKESNELSNDFKNQKKSNITDLIIEYKNISSRICETYVDDSLRKKYLDSLQSSVEGLNSDEVLLIKRLRSLK